MAKPMSFRTARRRRGPSPLARYWWAGLVLIAAVVGAASFLLRPRSPQETPLEGYLTDTAILEHEYAKFERKPLRDPAVVQDFDRAKTLMFRRDYAGAAAALERISKRSALPVVLNNLGVLYAELNDRGRSLNAFREALARDAGYAPVRSNMDRLRAMSLDTSDPVTREIEPNNNNSLANVISIDTPVEAEIEARTDDIDAFRVTTPPPPRDILAVELTPENKTMALGMRVYDSEMRLTDWGAPPGEAGAPVERRISPEPNAILFIQVYSRGGGGGPYSLRLRRTRSYDSFEPDDDVFSAHALTFGSPLEANIMDPGDTDFYSFEANRTGMVQIDVEPRSITLVPALTTFGPDKRNSGFGPNLRIPGAVLHHTMPVESGRTYYLQVWSQVNTTGIYTLMVR